MSQKIYKIVEKRNLWFLLSLAFIMGGIGVMGFRALNRQPVLNFGIDFISGSTMILKFETLKTQHQQSSTDNKDINIEFIKNVRQSLENFGLEKSAIQITNDLEVLIKTSLLPPEESKKLLTQLESEFGAMEVLEIDFIGPSIGAELRQKSIWIIIAISISLLLYITWRFEFMFGLAALIALLHDALITLSYSAITNLEVNTAFVAALLTVLGYSINDTIVIFDRIRENMRQNKGSANLSTLANLSLSQTIKRTVNTSLTTIGVILCLIVFGGSTIQTFSIVLLVGIISGTYSSVFIASPALIALSKNK